MDEELEEVFPWIPLIKREFLKSFSSDYEVGTLELLQQNITEEILKIKHKHDRERGKLLFQCIEYFYYHFCRKWYQWKKFSSPMEVAWVHILTSYLKIGIILSQGKKKSKWKNQVLTTIMRFPGEKNLMYDALLSVNCLNKKYQPVYGSILMYLLIYGSLFVPIIVTDPAEYLKLCLLFRRLKLLIKDPAEKSELQMKASKILAPPTLSNWLLAHDFNVTWINRTVRIDLRINIFKKLGGKESEKEVVESFRKILLPRICTQRKAKLERSCSELNETDQFTNKRNYIADNFDNIPLYVTDSFKKRNYVSMAHDDCVLLKDEKEIEVTENEVQNKKIKNRRKYLSVKSGDEVPSSEDNTEEIALNEMELKSKKMKRKRSCVSADETKHIQMEKYKKEKQSAFMCNNDSEAESKSKKKKQRKEALIVAEKNTKVMDDTSNEHLFPKDISKITKNRKTNKKGQKEKKLDGNSEEIELITISQESDADNLPVIVNEIKASEPVCNERVCVSEFRNVNSATSCFEDEPVIVTEIKHYPIMDQGSSQNKKSKPIKTELHSNTEAETKAATENIFVIDAEPSSCITESGNGQIAYDTIYDSEQRDITSCEKSQIINEDLNVSVSLANLQDEKLLSVTDSRLKITDKSHTSEEKEDSCTGKSSPLKNGHSQIIIAEPVSNVVDESFISEKETSLPSDKQTDINMDSQDCKQEGCSVISSNVEDSSGHFNQDEEKSSSDLAVQPESLNNFSDQASDFVENIGDIASDPISEKPGDKSIPIEVDSKNETIHGINISQEDITLVESHRICLSSTTGSCVQETEVQKDDFASNEADELVSDTNKIDFPTTNLIISETTESNSEVVEKCELKIENNSLACLIEKDKMMQEEIDSESSINPPLSNISVMKVDKTAQNTDCIESKNEIPSEHSMSSLLENKSCVQSMNPLDSNISSQEIEIKKENVETDSLLNKNDSEIATNVSSNESLEIENPSTLKDNASIDMHSPSQNNLIHELPLHKMPELLSQVKSPVLKPENSQRSVDHQILEENQNLDVKTKSDEVKTPNSSAANRLMENMLNLVEQAKNKFGSQNILKGDLTPTVHSLAQKFLSVTSPNNEISGKCLTFLDISTDSVGSHSENERFTCHASKSPEFLKYRDILIDQEDIKSEDTLSENKSISKADTSGCPSDASSDTDGEESNYLSDCNSPKSSDGVDEASNPKIIDDIIEKHKLCKENYDAKSKQESQDIVFDISKIHMLNPVVNLGERCDSKAFILENSSVISDSSVLTDVRTEEQEINQAPSTINLNKVTIKPEVIKGSPSSIHVLLTEKCDEISEMKNDNKIKIQPGQKEQGSKSVQEMTLSKESRQSVELTSEKNLSEDQEDIGYDKSQELFLSNKSLESVKPTSEKELSQDQEGTESDKSQELTICNEDQESVELASEKELSHGQESTICEKGRELTENGKENFMLSLRMRRLRNKPDPAIQPQKSSLANEDCSVLKENSPTTSVRSRRSRKPPASSSQEVRKSRSQTVTRRSSKKLKKEVNLDLDLSVLSLNSPKILRSKSSESSDKSTSEVVKDNIEPPTINQGNPCRRSTRASVISSTAETKIKDEDTDPEGYNLRSRKSVIMPGRLKF